MNDNIYGVLSKTIKKTDDETWESKIIFEPKSDVEDGSMIFLTNYLVYNETTTNPVMDSISLLVGGKEKEYSTLINQGAELTVAFKGFNKGEKVELTFLSKVTDDNNFNLSKSGAILSSRYTVFDSVEEAEMI